MHAPYIIFTLFTSMVDKAAELVQLARDAKRQGDKAKQREYMQAAAALGNAYAQFWIGNLYFEGDGVDQDYVKAFELFQQSAAQGCVDGQVNLAHMYDLGLGVQQDQEKGFQLTLKAALQGDHIAAYNLGAWYRITDPRESIRWFITAAERGDRDAALWVATLYRAGNPDYDIVRDTVKAIEMFKVAAQTMPAAQKILGLAYLGGPKMKKRPLHG